jgi:hypothetical protein
MAGWFSAYYAAHRRIPKLQDEIEEWFGDAAATERKDPEEQVAAAARAWNRSLAALGAAQEQKEGSGDAAPGRVPG